MHFNTRLNNLWYTYYIVETRRKIIFFKRQRRKRREPSRGSSKTPGDESEYTSNGSDYDVKTSSLSDEDILIG